MEKGKNIITFIRYHQQFPYQNDMMRKYQSLNIRKNIIIVIIVTLKTIIDMIGALFGSLFVKYVIGNNANLGAMSPRLNKV